MGERGRRAEEPLLPVHLPSTPCLCHCEWTPGNICARWVYSRSPMLCSLTPQMYSLCRILSVPGLTWCISSTWNFQGREQGCRNGDRKQQTHLPTCLCLRASQGLSAGIFSQSPCHTHTPAHLVQGIGQLSCSFHSPHPDQTCWENTVGHTVLRGPPNTTKQEDSWEGQGRETAVTRIA